MEVPVYQGKPILIRAHAIKRARQRQIAFPDQVYAVIKTGKLVRFGRRGVRFVKRGRRGSIICVGEEFADCIVIKTIERVN